MMLVDEGKVNLDDPVEKYLPEFKGQMVVAEKDAEHVLLQKPKHPITVTNVLTHTSGLPFKSAIEKPTLDMLPLRDAVRSYAMTPLQFEPGTQVPVLATPASTRRGASSRWSAACPTRSSCRSGCSSRWA